jgi:hypothetical protein
MQFSRLNNSSVHRFCALVFFLMLFNAASSLAQRYTLYPSDTDTMVDFAPPEPYSHFIFYITNLTDGELLFQWQQVHAEIPNGWIVGLCDYGHCYGQLEMSGTMDTMGPNHTGIFALGVEPENINGVATVSYALWEASTPSEIDTITWIISSNNATGILEYSLENSSYSNRKIYLLEKSNLQQLPFVVGDDLLVYRNNGQLVYRGKPDDAALCPAMKSWQDGLYFFEIRNNNAPKEIIPVLLK